jgi:uncharacterized protein (TIGR00369 family)
LSGLSITSPFVSLLGVEIAAQGDSYACIRLAVASSHAGTDGRAHGGVLTALLDTACALALWGARKEEARERAHASIEMSASFLSDVAVGDVIVAEGRVLRLGRQVAFAESEARRASDGQIVGRAAVTFAIQEPRP